jgi:hypothetical protein
VRLARVKVDKSPGDLPTFTAAVDGRTLANRAGDPRTFATGRDAWRAAKRHLRWLESHNPKGDR